MLRPDTFALTALLAILTGLGPTSVDMYLASLPEIGRALTATPATVQLTLSVYLVGYTIGQIFYGPVSDHYGRRPVLLLSLIVYCLASAACAAAPNIETLLVARGVQAIGVSGTVVLARAIVRDLYEGPRAARELSLMASIMALAPVGAPPIGGVLQTLFGWRSNFVFMVAVGVAATVVAWRLLPETLRRASDATISIGAIGASYRIVAANRAFLAYLGILAFSFGGLFAWISGLTFVLQGLYAVTPFEFGISFAFASLGYLTGTAIATRYVGRLGIDRTIGLGAIAQAVGGLLAVAVVALRIPYAWPLVFAMALYVCGLGLVQPQAMAGALAPFPDRAGAASSLLGVGQMSFAAIIGAGVGQALGGSAWPLVLTVAVMGALTLATWITTRALRARKT